MPADPAAGRVVVVGSANADLVLRIERRPTGGETVLADDVEVAPGGKGANQAVAAARVGAAVSFVGCVGPDDHGRLVRDALAGAGVDVGPLRTVDAPTGTAVVLLTPDGENAIVVSPGANRRVSPDLVGELVGGDGTPVVVVVQLEIPAATVAAVASLVRPGAHRLVLNAAPALGLPAEVLARADPLVVNESEAAHLLAAGGGGPGDDAGPVARAEALLRLGPASVVLTLGGKGAVVAARGARRPVHVPAAATDPVDTTGAGDAFVGALAAGLAAGEDLVTAARRASGVAAVVVGRVGAHTPVLEDPALLLPRR